MTISTTLHGPTDCDTKQYHATVGKHSEFNCLRFWDADRNDVALYWSGEHTDAAKSIAAIFNGHIEGLAARIEDAMDQVNDMDVSFSDFALAIACDLTGADLNEAYAARKAMADDMPCPDCGRWPKDYMHRHGCPEVARKAKEAAE